MLFVFELKMIGNQIGDNGAFSIGESLKLNKSLQQLYLGGKIYLFLIDF
jgi:hypothetical protein